MKLIDVKNILETIYSAPENEVIYEPENKKLYSYSIHIKDKAIFFIVSFNDTKYLFILSRNNDTIKNSFDGKIVKDEDGFDLKQCRLTTINRKALQEVFPETKPVTIGLKNSFGFGDRIGEANAGHLIALRKFDFMPVLAQQSIRELTRTNRTAEEVMDAAVWAVFQTGYSKGFGADGDHLKTKEDIDMLVKAGYTLFTFDPGEYVNNNADNLSTDELKSELAGYPWKEIEDTVDDARSRYLGKKLVVDNTLEITTDEAGLLRAYCKYGKCIAHVKSLYYHLKNKYPEHDSEVEMSVDETDSVTSVFEHYFIATELKRLGITFVSLAPRFVGDFEKGIDYKGDLKLFEEEYKKHAAIAAHYGYKISLHSGSDKFSVYEVIGKLKKGLVHVKTAGTSYLEALKVAAIKNPQLFREILEFSKGLYDNEKRTYHVSAEPEKLKLAKEYKNEELPGLFDSIDARQVLHVTFGRVLTEKDRSGNYLFKDRLIHCLKEHEQLHYEILVKHFNRHMQPFV